MPCLGLVGPLADESACLDMNMPIPDIFFLAVGIISNAHIAGE